MAERFLGIDFSGGAAPWRAGTRRPTVWIATASSVSGRLLLDDLIPVQALSGEGEPFDRLTALLAGGQYRAAAIDAPFSIPARHLSADGHAELLAAVSQMTHGPKRPFPLGAALVSHAEAIAPKASHKPLRACELHWAKQGVNVRSTLWNGPRGGAPVAVACLSLIARAGRPCWPWTSTGSGLLMEAFPAAQLRHWELAHQRYSASAQIDVRRQLVAALEERIDFSPGHRQLMEDSADALDAVLCLFAGTAAQSAAVPTPSEEGWIAVA